MKNLLFSLIGSYVVHPAREVAVSVSGDRLMITRDHQQNEHHAIEDIDIMINGHEIIEDEYSTQITAKEEIVTIILPVEPQPGDVIVVDTEIHRLGSKKVTLKIE